MNLPHLSTLPDWSDFERVALDIETKDPGLTTLGPGVRRSGKYAGFITGVSFACDDGTNCGPAFYLPMRHEGGGNYTNHEQVLAYLRHQAKHFRGDIVGANLQYDLDWLAESDVLFRPRFFRDIQVSGPLLDQPELSRMQDDEGNWFWGYIPARMGLEAQAEHLGLPGKDERELDAWAERTGLDPKADMWRAPADLVARYAIQDVRLPLQIIKLHEREIEAQELWAVYNLESRLLPVLLKMRRRGVRIDPSKLEQVELRADELEARAMAELKALTGVKVKAGDTQKNALLADCFKAIGVKLPKTPTGKDSIKAGWLNNHPSKVAKLILEARKWAKVRTTFVKSISNHAIDYGGGHFRIHCTFNQLRQERETGEVKGAAFGRLSSSDPNLQQQPARDREIGPLWRSIYVPDEGGRWACLDFSSQEPRMITHYAELTAKLDKRNRIPTHVKEAAYAAANACRTDPNWDNHSMMAAMMYDDFDPSGLLEFDADGQPTKRHKYMKGLRGDAKTIFLGLCYGMGSGKLAISLGLPVVKVWQDWAYGGKGGEVVQAGDEGMALLNRFRERVPYVQALQKMVQAKAQKAGYITTLLGRRCRFPRHPKTGRIEWAHKGLNRLIQGSSADQTKQAMVLADEAGIRLQLQVHDEIDMTFWDPMEIEAAREIMVNAVQLNVPSQVDVETGPSWGEIS